jgi:hypothetical protein
VDDASEEHLEEAAFEVGVLGQFDLLLYGWPVREELEVAQHFLVFPEMRFLRAVGGVVGAEEEVQH